MNIYSLMPAIALSINGFVIIYFLSQKRSNTISKSYIYYSLNLFLLISAELILTFKIPAFYILTLFKIASIFWISIGFWFLNFAYEFTKKNKDWFFSLIGIISIIAIIISLLSDFVIEGFTFNYWGPDEVIGVLFFPLILTNVIIPIIYSLYLIEKKRRAIKSTSIKRAARIILIGSLLSLIIALVSNFALPNIFDIRSSFQFAEIASVVQSFFIFLAIYNTQAFYFELEDVYYNLFSTMIDGVIILNDNMNIVHINNAAKELLNISNEKNESERISHLLEDILRIKENEREERIYNINGITKYVLITRSVITQDETQLGNIFFFEDITLRKETEKQLIESQKRFADLFESSPDALIVVDKEGKIIRLNPEVQNLFGYSKNELLGKEISILIPQRFRITHNRHVEGYKNNPRKRRMGDGLDLFGLKKDGSEFSVDIMLSPMTQRDKKITLCTVRDVSDKIIILQRLKDSEEHYRNIFQTHPHGIVETTLDGTITLANNAYAHIYEFEVNEIIGKKVWEIHEDKEFINNTKKYFKVSNDGTLIPQSLTSHRKTKTGKIIEVQIDWDYKRDIDNIPIGYIKVVTDITEKKKAERNLNQNRLMLAQAENLAHLGSWKYNIKTNKLFWSDELFRIYGENKNTFKPTIEEFHKRLHPEDRNIIISKTETAINDGVAFSHIERIIRPDGEIRILSSSGVPQKNDSGEVIELYGSCLDVTEYKKIEDTLCKNSIILNQAEELSHLGSWEYNIKTNKLFWSDELYKIFGLNIQEFNPSIETVEKLWHPDTKTEVQDNFYNALKTYKAFSHLEKIIRPDGEVRMLLTKATVNTDKNNNAISMVGSTLDVTELKKIEAELLISQTQLRALAAKLQTTNEEEKKRLAREIHDEFGQILTAVNMDVGVMINEIQINRLISTETLIDNLQSIESLIKKSIKSVQNIATMLRPDVLDHLDLISALEWHAKEFEKRFKIETIIEKSLTNFSTNDDMKIALFRIFQEGLTNVARHSEATKVYIFLSNNNDIFKMKIIDNGIGISADKLNNINSIGLIGMRERVLILNGKINISAVINGGTELHLEVPIN